MKPCRVNDVPLIVVAKEIDEWLLKISRMLSTLRSRKGTLTMLSFDRVSGMSSQVTVCSALCPNV